MGGGMEKPGRPSQPDRGEEEGGEEEEEEVRRSQGHPTRRAGWEGEPEPDWYQLPAVHRSIHPPCLAEPWRGGLQEVGPAWASAKPGSPKRG